MIKHTLLQGPLLIPVPNYPDLFDGESPIMVPARIECTDCDAITDGNNLDGWEKWGRDYLCPECC